MAAMSDWLEGVLASHIFGSGTFSKPAELYIGLAVTPLVDSEHQDVSGKEVGTGLGYARKQLDPSSDDWLDPVAANGQCYNHTEVLFGPATSNWGWVSGVFIADDSTIGTGNVLVHGSLTTPKNVENGDELKLSSGNMVWTFA